MDLNYRSYGDHPGRTPLIVLHGLFGSLENWQTLARRWAERFPVILVDLPNHGRSPHADTANYPDMARALVQWLREMDISRCHLLGHSMGGKVAMQTALEFSELVEKLIIVDMAPRRYGRGHDDVFAALNALDPADLRDRRHADELMQPHMADAGVRMFLLKNLTRDDGGGYRWRMNLEVLYRDYDQLVAPVGDLGQTYEGPALFIRGGDSGYVKDEDMDFIRVLFPTAELLTVAGAGHWVHAERPGELGAAVEEFLVD